MGSLVTAHPSQWIEAKRNYADKLIDGDCKDIFAGETRGTRPEL